MNKKRFFPLILVTLLTGCSNGNDLYKRYDFNHSQGMYDYEDYMYYSDEIFKDESTSFNPKLASASISFSMASFASMETSNYKNKSIFANELLTDLGFIDFEVNEDYLKKPEKDTIGLLAAHKKIDDYELIAIGVRGAAYYSEWASNFTIGNREDGYHEGFRSAADKYLSFAKDYIINKNIKGNIKIWASGYSRGGATTNLAIGLLDEAIANNQKPLGDNININKEDIYCYCFEAPKGAPNKRNENNEVIVKGDNYSNIFNIINVNDPVPYVTMSELGFTRYGKDIFMPDPLLNLDYEDHFKNMNYLYNRMSNHQSLGYYAIDKFLYKGKKGMHHMSQALFLKELVHILATTGMSHGYSIEEEEVINNYVNNVQTGLRNLFATLYSSESFKGSFVDIGIALINDIDIIDEVDYLIEDLKVEGPSAFINDFRPMLTRALNSLHLEIDVKKTVNDIIEFLKILGYTMFEEVAMGNTYALMNWFYRDNIKAIASGHYPELCAAHVRSLDDSYVNNPFNKYEEMDGKYYRLFINNNQSSIIIKNEGETIVNINNGEELDNNISYRTFISGYEIYLPYHEKYEVIIGEKSEIVLDYYDSYYEEYIDIPISLDSNNSFVIN